MTDYAIVVCSKCGRFLLAEAEQRTRTCPYCGSKVTLDKAKKIASAKTASEASRLLSELKQKEAIKKKHDSNPW